MNASPLDELEEYLVLLGRTPNPLYSPAALAGYSDALAFVRAAIARTRAGEPARGGSPVMGVQ